MRRQGDERGVSRLAVVLFVLVVGAAVAIGVVVASDDDDEAPAAATSSTTTTEPLGEEAEDLLARLERGRAEPVHVRMETAGSAAGEDAVTLEIWRDGDLVRQDVAIVEAGTRTDVSSFQLADGNVFCQRTDDAPWQCQKATSVATENGQPAGLIEAVAASLEGADVVATDEDVDGRAARCFAIDRPDGSSTLCVTDDGVPVRLVAQDRDLLATTVEREVAAEVFTPPAEVSDGA